MSGRSAPLFSIKDYVIRDNDYLNKFVVVGFSQSRHVSPVYDINNHVRYLSHGNVITTYVIKNVKTGDIEQGIHEHELTAYLPAFW